MEHARVISVTGLGYVGLTIAAAFSHVGMVIAFDVNADRIKELKEGYDKNEEVAPSDINLNNILFTTNLDDLKQADFHIISVPTPIDETRHPNFDILLDATKNIGSILKKSDIVVYESSVYPGATEERCLPLLEQISGLICGIDFAVGYSPERINPGDKEHVFSKIVKIISATDEKTLDIMEKVYASVVENKIYRASSIRVAEAAKIIENTQRDINIAFINDMAIMLHALGIDTKQVLQAMQTKWNALPFRPGLVGGHCIGVNSYYLMEKAEAAGHYSDIIVASRTVNEYLAKFIANQAVKVLSQMSIAIKDARVAILGITYKANCSDLRDTQVTRIIEQLKTYDINVMVHDPIASPEAARNEYNIDLVNWDQLANLDAIILTVAHKQYIKLGAQKIKEKLKNPALIMDITEMLNPDDFTDTCILIWRL